MTLLDLGDEQRGRTLWIGVGWTHVAVGYALERYRSEWQLTVFLGPFAVRFWKARHVG